jgi:hypothetical protein
MSLVLLVDDDSARVELPEEPRALAHAILTELGEEERAAALEQPIGRETDAGFEYSPRDVTRMIEALEIALEAIAEHVDDEGSVEQAPVREGPFYFNERQWLKRALAVFHAARAAGRSARVSV